MKFRMLLSILVLGPMIAPAAMSKEKPKSQSVEVATIQDAIDAYFQTIPLRKDDSTWLRYVPAKIDGTEILMLIDSGAHRTFFDVDAARKAGIKLKRSKKSVSGARGSASSYVGEIDSIQIGDIVKIPKGIRYFVDLGHGKNIEIDGKPAKCGGLWGFDIMGAADFNIDLPNNRILIAKASVNGGYWSLLEQSGYRKIDLVASKSAIYIPVKLGEKQGFFQIDTGSSQMIIFEPFAKGKNYAPLKKGGSVLGVGGTKQKARFVTVTDFAIPGYRIESPMLVVPSDQTTMLQGKPVMGILGIPVIEQFKMVFNFRKHHLYMPAKTEKHGE